MAVKVPNFNHWVAKKLPEGTVWTIWREWFWGRKGGKQVWDGFREGALAGPLGIFRIWEPVKTAVGCGLKLQTPHSLNLEQVHEWHRPGLNFVSATGSCRTWVKLLNLLYLGVCTSVKRCNDSISFVGRGENWTWQGSWAWVHHSPRASPCPHWPFPVVIVHGCGTVLRINWHNYMISV